MFTRRIRLAVVGVMLLGCNMRGFFGGSTKALSGSTQAMRDSNAGVREGRKSLNNFSAVYVSGTGLVDDSFARGDEGLGAFASVGGRSRPASDAESYAHLPPNAPVTAAEDHLSTFSVDVDTASYTLARRKLQEGDLPDTDSVRVEEFLNYFQYDYASPTQAPIAIHLDAARSPVGKGKTLLRVGLKAHQVTMSERKTTHLTFLIDVSGSMGAPDRLPLAQRALDLLVDHLRDGDTVGIVTYASGVQVVLPPTGMDDKRRIHSAIDGLTAGGSTAMGDGLGMAYAQAAKELSPDSQSRVIVMSDGDANVGTTSQDGLQNIIAAHVKEGVTLSVVGLGVGNYKDDLMESLADKGNGNYYYCDSIESAQRIFQRQIASTLDLVAKDVKVQVDFDPESVKHYRLIGYENRALADASFRNDHVDAGDMGSGHEVTALYELDLAPHATGRLATVRVRAKAPRGETALEYEASIAANEVSPSIAQAAGDLRFATAVAGFAQLLRHDPSAEGWTLAEVARLARTAAGSDERVELLSLVDQAQRLRGEMVSLNDRRLR